MNWALHNSLKGWTLYDLTDQEVQLLIQSMSANEIKLVKICSKIEKKWTSLEPNQHPELFKKNKPTDSSDYPVRGQDSHGVDQDTDYFVIKPKKVFYPRLHDRIDISLKAHIESASQRFETSTLDISEGGINFVDLIPDWIAGYFIVRLFVGDESCQIMCSLVEDQKSKHRVQVVSEESDPHFLQYKELLVRLKPA